MAITFSVPVRVPMDAAAAAIASILARSDSSGTTSLRTRSAVNSASSISTAAPASMAVRALSRCSPLPTA
jgi:hypothetical protein